MRIDSRDAFATLHEAFEESQVYRIDQDGSKVGLLCGGDGVGGAIVKTDGYAPAESGTVVYLQCGQDLSAALGRVELHAFLVEMGQPVVAVAHGATSSASRL